MSYYNTITPTMRVNVLGTDYNIYKDVSKANDPLLNQCDAYCDKTTKRIVISDLEDSELDDISAYGRYCLRHEIIHAFLIESGLGVNANWTSDGEEHPEQMVEWMGMQFPKILAAFQAVGAL